ncbi:hypothetical protein SAMN05443575_0294 [Jatrophihabitans endophyticus]|uniref:DUF6286 domain-containing protein n=1 Tax=Jatrophihabitans endophyticus TaxID=1206085 RepID=A0A1M5CMR5_9ACTN|nr:DUF6286 domain-containing protein [Jatrophihabitans endophyticus]SHF56013.1 hypothetical protein SAMN05443575_0294 [Jatrophihabitans endophyticus]
MRLLNRLLAALVSLALVVVGVLLIIEVVADRVNHRPAVVKWHGAYDWAHRTSWTQGSVRVACIVVAALGLILLVAELKRTRVTRFRVEDKESGAEHPVDVAYTRRGVAGAVRTAVTDVDGVRSARVTVKRRSVTVRADTSARDAEGASTLLEPSREAAQQRLDALALAHTPKLKLTTAPRKR